MAAVKQFYRSVPKKHSLDVAFCLCKWGQLIFIKAATRSTSIVNGHQYLTLCFDFFRKNGNDEQCFRAQNILHPPCAQVSCQHVLAISTKINKKYHFLNLFTPGTPWLIIITTNSYHNLVSSFRLPLVGMAKRQTFRHVTRWQGTAGLKTSIISLAVLLV